MGRVAAGSAGGSGEKGGGCDEAASRARGGGEDGVSKGKGSDGNKGGGGEGGGGEGGGIGCGGEGSGEG